MNEQQIKSLLNIGENCETEFKESKNKLPKSIWETYSAFANSKGGVIILGIEEDNKTKVCTVTGVENEKSILKDFWNSINNKEKVSCNILTDDDVEIGKIEEKNVIIINIPRADRRSKPIYINNNPMKGTYKRYHDGDFKCEEHEVKVMIQESTENTKDGIIIEDYDINNIDKATLESYRKRFRFHKGDNHEWNDLSDEDFLYMINALDRRTKKMTLAGLLMFGKIQEILYIKPNYFLDYRETINITSDERWSNRITSAPDEEYNGNLWSFFTKIVNKLTADIEVPFELDENMMRINDTKIHECVRERISKLFSTCRFFRKWQYCN